MDIDAIIQKYPKFNFLKSATFEALSQEKKEFLLGCVEDALFWVELEKKPHSSDGFKFLAASYGLQQAEDTATEKGLHGADREKFLASIKEVYSRFNPHAV